MAVASCESYKSKLQFVLHAYIGSKYLSVYMYVFVCVCLQREATVAEGVDEVSADG